MSLPDFVPVEKSSNIAATAHDGSALFVKFKNGGVFKYPGVSADEHQAMLKADSVGSHFHRHVKAKYSGSKVG